MKNKIINKEHTDKQNEIFSMVRRVGGRKMNNIMAEPVRNKNMHKAVMIGCGFVGSATVFSLMQSGMFSEIVMIDADKAKAEGEAMDISHGIPFSKHMKIYAGDYDDIGDAGLVIITAGANQKPDETRLQLVQRNVGVYKHIIPELTKRNYDGIIIVVTNPVDVLTNVAQRLSGLPEHRVIGSGTVLDTARLKYELGKHLEVDSRSVHAFIIGEHGDSEMAVWSSANVSGINLEEFGDMNKESHYDESTKRISENVRNSAYEIINKKQATYYGVAMAVRRICEVIVRDEKSILPVSVTLHGEYGVEGVTLSVPSIVGKSGIYRKVPIALDSDEMEKFKHSANVLKGILDSVQL